MPLFFFPTAIPQRTAILLKNINPSLFFPILPSLTFFFYYLCKPYINLK